MNVSIGDLVTIHEIYVQERDSSPHEITGIVLDIELMNIHDQDSKDIEPRYLATVLWESNVPSWICEGRICKVPDSILKVINDETW